MTRVHRIWPPHEFEDAVDEAGRILRSGGLVVFPTETVYGIACADAPKAVERLFAAKRRPAEKRVAHYVGSWRRFVDLARSHGFECPAAASRTAKHAFPGPLTLVLREGEQTFGARCPDHPVAQALIEAARTPIVGTSANLSGRPPARTAEEAMEQLGGIVDLVIDAGPCPYGVASTVVEFDETGARRVLREGALGERDLDRCLRFWLLFVCSANLCRSPFAAAFCARQSSAEKEENLFIDSAGVRAVEGYTPPRSVCEAAERYGVDLSGHRSKAATADLLERFDRIFAMDRENLQALGEISPSFAGNAALLDPSGEDIPDPMSGLPAEIVIVYDKIIRCLERRRPELCELR